MSELLTLRLRFEHDVVIARQRAREAARLLGFRTQDQTRVATAVSELARRAFRAGREGTVTFLLDREGRRPRLVLRVRHPRAGEGEDGVRSLDEVLTGTRRLMDAVRAERVEGVVTVEADQYLRPDVDTRPLDVEEIVSQLRHQSPNNPFEELQQQNEELVQAMAALREQEQERSRLLEAERQAREEAQRAVRGREEILSIVSHDLRNPIGAIQTGATFLLEHPDLMDGSVGRKQLGAILRSAERANRLIQDLLDLSSIEQGGLSVHTRALDVTKVMEEMEELMAGRARDAEVQLELRNSGNLPPVCGDLDRMVQALGNLVGNAIKFTPPGGRVRVTTVDEGGRVRFSVADSGPGVPQNDRDRLFDRFWKSSEHGGAGLGLAIVQGIARGHGGRVWLDESAAPDGLGGALFHLTVPVAGSDCDAGT